jgi:hypothetical protein
MPGAQACKGVSGGAIWKAEADVELLRLVPPAASANCDAAFTVERFKLKALAAEASWRQLQLDKVRKSRSFMCPVISDLRRLIWPSLLPLRASRPAHASSSF